MVKKRDIISDRTYHSLPNGICVMRGSFSEIQNKMWKTAGPSAQSSTYIHRSRGSGNRDRLPVWRLFDCDQGKTIIFWGLQVTLGDRIFSSNKGFSIAWKKNLYTSTHSHIIQRNFQDEQHECREDASDIIFGMLKRVHSSETWRTAARSATHW